MKKGVLPCLLIVLLILALEVSAECTSDDIQGNKRFVRQAKNQGNIVTSSTCIAYDPANQPQGGYFTADPTGCPASKLRFHFKNSPAREEVIWNGWGEEGDSFCLDGEDRQDIYDFFSQDYTLLKYDPFLLLKEGEHGYDGNTNSYTAFIYVKQAFSKKGALAVDDDGWINFYRYDMVTKQITFAEGISFNFGSPLQECGFTLPRGWYFIEFEHNDDGGPSAFIHEMDFDGFACDYLGYAGEEIPSFEASWLTCELLNPSDDCDSQARQDVCERSQFDFLSEAERTAGVTYNLNKLCCGDDTTDPNSVNGDKMCVDNQWQGFSSAYCTGFSFDEDTTGVNPTASDGSDACCGDDSAMPSFGQGTCTGTISWNCADQSSGTCESVQGCNWRAAGCSGTPTPCLDYEQETCPVGQGCVWKQNRCRETTRICTPSWDPATCTSQGCVYTSGTGVCVDDPIQQCNYYNIEQTCTGNPECSWTPPVPDLTNDIGYITPDDGNLCLKDKTVNEDPTDPSISIDYQGRGTWSWWAANKPEAQFTIHDLLGATQLASNNEDWFYCDATGLLGNLYSVQHLSKGDNEVLPGGLPVTSDHQGLYQYWPDRDCDGYADCDRNKNGLIDDPTVSNPSYWQSCYPNPAGACALAPDGKRYGENGGTNPQENCLDRQNFPNYPPEIGCTSDSPPPPAPGCGSPSGTDNPIKEGYVWDRSTTDCYPENYPPTFCSDSNDNDLDGFVDCNDPDCWYTKDQNDQYICTLPQGRENCGDFIDNNNNGHIDCDDQDCAGYSGEGSNCPGTVYTPTFSSASSTLLCYQDAGKNMFGECCPPGKLDCYNIDNPNIDSSLFALGSSTHTLVSVTTRSLQTPSLEDRMRYFNEYQNNIILNSEDWSGFSSVTFDFITNNADMNVKFTNTDDLTKTLDLASYYFDGGKRDVFHHITIPIQDITFANNNKRIKLITFVPVTNGASFKVILDNLRLNTPGTAIASANRFCAGDGSWIADLDPDPATFDRQDPTTFQAQMFACNAQVPQGYGGIGWTGSQCCGDDSNKMNFPDSVEFFKDTQAGCFLGSKIPDGKTVGFILNDPAYNDRLFYQGEFWSCVQSQMGLQVQHSIFSSQNERLIPQENVVPLCTKKGSKVCVLENSRGVWKDFSDAGDSCGIRDWYNHYAKICPSTECYCPKDKGNEYADCPAETDCVADATVIKDRLCNAGNWTSRTALVAGYLYDFAKDKNDFVLTCNLPLASAYEGDLWADISDSLCVLRIPGNENQLGDTNAQTVIGAALKLNADGSDTLNSIGSMYSALNSPPNPRLNVPYPQMELSNCENADKCVNENNFKLYYLPEKHLVFISNKDISGLQPANALSKWKWLYDLYNGIESWFVIEASQSQLNLSTSMTTLYLNKKNSKLIYGYQEKSFDPPAPPATALKEFLDIEFRGFTGAQVQAYLQSFQETGKQSRLSSDNTKFFKKDARPEDLARLQQIRLSS